jgi:hypothetical protein
MTRSYSRGNSAEAAGVGAAPTSRWLPRSHSGRRFVLVAGLAVLLIWGLLFLVFREWRARYRERASYGATQVIPAIDPMAEVLPPGVDPTAWQDAVDSTHDMLLTVTASNLLDVDEMRSLRAELEATVKRARARPETAIAELAGIWDEMAERGEFFFKDSRSRTGARHPRPRLLPTYGETRVVPALRPLGRIVPPGVEPAEWRDALSRTSALLLAVTDSGWIDTTRMRALRSYLDQDVSRAESHPETAVEELAGIWNTVFDRYAAIIKNRSPDGRERFPRPKILPPRR